MPFEQVSVSVADMTHDAHRDHPGHRHQPDDAGLLEVLELDATLSGSQIEQIIGWLSPYAPQRVHSIVDVGAGLGGGSVALAEQFPEAWVQAVDRSEPMLARVRESAGAHGLADRISTLPADLDQEWPREATGADVVWAASSLHEVADPERTFVQIHAALRPGGLLAVVELTGLPRFLPDDVGLGEPGLEARLRRVLSGLGWNRQLEWEQLFQAAGFELLGKAGFSAGGGHSAEAARKYARTSLARIRPALQAGAATADLATLDAILAGEDPGALLQRGGLDVRVDRVAWAARKR